MTAVVTSSVFFSSSGFRLHAARHRASGAGGGEGGGGGDRGRPIVVVPGITTPAGAFAFAADALAQLAGAGDVYVLDMRGRGLSERAPSGEHRSADYGEDVVALVDHLELWERRPLLVGHSLGARVVAQARALVPGCSAGVVAMDPPLSGPGRRPYPTGLEAFLEQIHGARGGRGLEQVRQHYPNWTEEQAQQRVDWLGSCDELAIVESFSWFHLEAFEPVWHEVDPPALLLYGENSPVVTADDLGLLEAVNPRADVVAIAGAAHMIPWDNPTQTASEIESFLSRLEANR